MSSTTGAEILILLSCARRDRTDEWSMSQQLTELLRQRWPGPIVVMPHIYDLPLGSSAWEIVRRWSDHLAVIAWLYPRAMFWILHAQGIRGIFRAVGLSDADAGQNPPAAGPDGRLIWCIDARQFASGEPLVERLRQASGVLEVGRSNSVEIVAEETSPRWYPVIDYDRCNNCKACINFCLFGVYGLDQQEVPVAENPDACRDGCPACARVCPTGAIMFPEYQDPVIAGAAEGKHRRIKLDVSQLMLGDLPTGATAEQLAELERRVALEGKNPSEVLRSGQSFDKAQNERIKKQDSGGPSDDELKRLVDELDEWDV